MGQPRGEHRSRLRAAVRGAEGQEEGGQGAQGATGVQGSKGATGPKGANALGTLIGGAEIGENGGFAYSATDGLLTFTSGSTKFVVLMYTSGSS